MVKEPKLQNTYFKTLHVNDYLSISKIEQGLAISVSQGKEKSQYIQIVKSRNLDEFLKFLPNFLQVSSISEKVQLIHSNMGPKTTPSLSPGMGQNHNLGSRA